jgi:hypothetical protein
VLHIRTAHHISGLMFNVALHGQTIEILVRTHMRTPVRPLVTHSSMRLLWPQPQRIVELEGLLFVPQKELHICVIQTRVHSQCSLVGKRGLIRDSREWNCAFLCGRSCYTAMSVKCCCHLHFCNSGNCSYLFCDV